MKEDTAIVQLVLIDDELGASFIYCSRVLKLICLDQELVRGMLCKHKHMYSALIDMKVSLSFVRSIQADKCGCDFAM